ncbi:MAG: 4-(cytidine 5'-diphospho)-2-C-methyl-D-erythritol kinase [Candidatus Kapabacteria bacterium]|nr:4-(cytidine 5'-diphospho)-2-C-methyl-D-erythritol kinase [Candidatus Kapabacteria bacterium]MDW8012221.1 4-(cytidine 5'-diphospho)-2-C-methyl-D-erythritol kinase [Bacteroidota bacterium]
MTLTEFAPAKLNLGLWVLGRRPDGYHELLSLMLPLDFGDHLVAEEAPEICVEYEPPQEFAPDLVRMAAELLRKEWGLPSGAKILVRKRIPVGAGLGGGSSDAAAALRLLTRLWKIGLSREQLLHLAQRLGSDVPFFLYQQPALVRGRGERVQPVLLSLPYTFVVLYPGFSISTAWAYAQLQRSERWQSEPEVPWDYVLSALSREPGLFQRYFANDFEPLLFAHYPKLRELRYYLLQSGAFYAGVTGSGSAVFGIFETETTAQAAARQYEDSAVVRAYVCRMYSCVP